MGRWLGIILEVLCFPIRHNLKNVCPNSCIDTENLCPDYIDHLMCSIPYSSFPFPEVGVCSHALAVISHMDELPDFITHIDEFAEFFHSLQNPS